MTWGCGDLLGCHHHLRNVSVNREFSIPFLNPHLFQDSRSKGSCLEFVSLTFCTCLNEHLFCLCLLDRNLVECSLCLLDSLVFLINGLHDGTRILQAGSKLLKMEMLFGKSLTELRLDGTLNQVPVADNLISCVLVELNTERILDIVEQSSVHDILQLLAVLLEYSRSIAVNHLQ